MPKLPAEHVPTFFTCSRTLYRVLADGTCKEVTFVNEGRLMVTLNGERLAAVDIAWCLHWGSWPKFRLVQLDGDPFNCSIENIMPVRVQPLRYREKRKDDGLYYHSLSTTGFQSSELCRRNWALYARDHYMKDLDYVLRVEAEERKLRAASGVAPAPVYRRNRLVRERAPVPTARPARPAAVEGKEWHWWEGAWVSVPVACHVADDYMQRIRRTLAGAVRFEFQPAYSEVWGFDAAGAVVH